MKRKGKGGTVLLNPEQFAGIYAEIAEQIDSETAVRLFEMFRGQMVIFPQKLYNREYVRVFLREHRQEYTVREFSRMFGYSDRRIREFLSEIQTDDPQTVI